VSTLYCFLFDAAHFLAIGTTPKPSVDGPLPEPPPPPSHDQVIQILAALNDHLTKLHSVLPPHTALIVATGHSDPRHMAVLNVRKTAFETLIRQGKSTEEIALSTWGSRWTAADGRELEEAVELTKRGLLFLGVKQ
jgi:RNA exonuclease 1